MIIINMVENREKKGKYRFKQSGIGTTTVTFEWTFLDIWEQIMFRL